MTVPRQQSPPPSLESIPKAVVGFRRTLFADETRREFGLTSHLTMKIGKLAGLCNVVAFGCKDSVARGFVCAFPSSLIALSRASGERHRERYVAGQRRCDISLGRRCGSATSLLTGA